MYCVHIMFCLEACDKFYPLLEIQQVNIAIDLHTHLHTYLNLPTNIMFFIY
jgi:hypothetical protein